MNKVSAKAQIIVTLIPAVNIFVFHIWIYNFYNYYRVGLSVGEMVKVVATSILVTFACAIPVIVVLFMVNSLVPGISSILAQLGTYLTPLAIGVGLIWYQEKLA